MAGLVFSLVICCIPFAGADDSNRTVLLDNRTENSGDSVITASLSGTIPEMEVSPTVTLLQTIIPTPTAVISPVTTRTVELTSVETTMEVTSDTLGTSPTPTPAAPTDFTEPPTSESETARSAMQSLDASESTQTWIQQTAAAGWGPRIYHSSVVMKDDSITVIGGLKSGTTLMNDVWRSTDKGKSWTPQTTNAPWSARHFHSSSVAMSDGTIVLMGGSGFGSTFVNTVWRSTDNGARWTELPNVPWLARSAHTSIALSDDSIVMMGGASDDPYHDVWLSADKGATWQRQTANGGWMERFRFAAVALPNDHIVIMGGATDYGHKNDVWMSADKGVTWTQMTSSAGWSPRECHTAVALPDGSIVLMGGYDDNSAKNDVWISKDEGVTWTQLPDAEWRARGGHTSVALSDGSIIVMGCGSDVWNTDEYASVRADFDADRVSGDVPLTVKFSDKSASYKPITDWNWNFGDGTQSSTDQNPSHTYAESGTYTVTLTIRGESGTTDTEVKNQYVTVIQPAEVPKTVGFTFVEKNAPGHSSLVGNGKGIMAEQEEHLNNWAVTTKYDNLVTRQDFGTDAPSTQGLVNSVTLHYHMGHGNLEGGPVPRLVLYDNQEFYMYANEVSGKWNSDNKWVILDSCLQMSTDEWPNAMVKTHGIMGYVTEVPASYTKTRMFAGEFFENANNKGYTVYQAFRKATKTAYKYDTVGARAVFRSKVQADNDYLPGVMTGVSSDFVWPWEPRFDKSWDTNSPEA